MCWLLVIDYPYTTFDNCCSQEVSIKISGYGLIYKPIMCNPKIFASKIVAIFLFMYFFQVIAFSLEFASLRKKNKSPLLLLLNTCKLSYFINYRCHNHTPFMVFSVTHSILRCMLGSMMTNNFIISVTSRHSAFKCAYWHLGMSTFNNVMRCILCYTMVDKYAWEYNIFLLHTEM